MVNYSSFRCYLPIQNNSENPEAEGDNNTSTEEAPETPLVNGANESNTLEKVLK